MRSSKIKKAILSIYDLIFPPESLMRHNLYSTLLWKIFPDKIDMFIDKYCKARSNIFFIQVGANDGKKFDRLRKFIYKYKLSGVLVEPIKSTFKELKSNYNRIENIYFENIAISDTNEVKDFFYLEGVKHKNITKSLSHLGSLHRSILQNQIGILKPKAKINSKKIECKSLNFLFDKYDIKHLNILLIDTEGWDAKIINGIDFDKYTIDLLVFEHIHLTEYEKNSCRKLMENQGYVIIENEIDSIAINRIHKGLMSEI